MATPAQVAAAKVVADKAIFDASPIGQVVALTGVSADQVSALVASHSGQGVSDARRASQGPSEWVGGIAEGSYTDVYNTDGSLKTFATSATKDLDETLQKVAGRIVSDENGQEFKMYKKFLGLVLGMNAEGVEILTIEGQELVFLAGATFGIKSEPNTAAPQEEYMGQMRHPVKHTAYVS